MTTASNVSHAGALPVGDARALARALRERALPGRRPAAAITSLRRERAARRAGSAADGGAHGHPDSAARLAVRLTARYTAEVARRGGDTAIEDKHRATPLALVDRDRVTGVVLLRAAGWRYYSSRVPSRFVELAYLCGVDDNGNFAVRVPGTVTTVAAALDWLTPAPVHAARSAGRRVVRQGDVYAIETTARYAADSGWVVEHHYFTAAAAGTGGVLRHTVDDGDPAAGLPHADLVLPFPARFVVQSPYGMGRGGSRGAGRGD